MNEGREAKWRGAKGEWEKIRIQLITSLLNTVQFLSSRFQFPDDSFQFPDDKNAVADRFSNFNDYFLLFIQIRINS